MKLASKIKKLNTIPFPSFEGDRAYMVPIKKGERLPDELARWQPTVDSMLQGVDVQGESYLTVHQTEVEAGNSQRRGGVHFDGNWEGKWNTGGSSWKTEGISAGGIILACDKAPPKAYLGEFVGEVGEGGDCSAIDVTDANVVQLDTGSAYLGNVTMLHEAMPVEETTERTFVRITLPSDFKMAA